MSTEVLVCFPDSAVLESEDDLHKTVFLFSVSAVVTVVLTFSRVSDAVQELDCCNAGRVNSVCTCVDQA